MSILAMPASWTALALSMTLLVAAAHGQSPRSKPRVPPGIDPGGVTVAIIGNGIDYSRPEIARRLARDGEGEIIGWDYVDGDRLPFEVCGARNVAPDHCNESPLAILTSAKARIVPLRARLDNPRSLVDAVNHATKTGARIVLVALPDPPPSRFIDEAAGFNMVPLFISSVVADRVKPPFRFLMGVNLIIANSATDDTTKLAVDLAAVLIAAVDCARDPKKTANEIGRCALEIPEKTP